MALKLKRSAGVRVTRFVHGKISAGNAAKLQGDNPAAITAYRVALDQDPSLGHIWVQLGHVLKDSGQVDEAVAAYREAVSRGGRHGADALLHLGRLETSLGHQENGRGRSAHAVRHFVQALEIDPAAVGPRQALEQILSLARAGGDVSLGEIRLALAGEPSVGSGRARRAGGASLFLDCTALVHALRDTTRADDAVGRQSGRIDAALTAAPDRVRLAHFHPDTGSWIELSDQDYAAVRAALAAGPDNAEQDGLRLANRILLASAMRDPLEFPKGSWIVGLGTPCDGADYPLPFMAACHDSGARYAAVVDDLQPLTLPQFSSQERRVTAALWLLGLLNAADVIFAASGETAGDLVRIAGDAGFASPEERMVVVPPFAPPGPVAASSRSDVPAGSSYALVVGDLDSAKGHLTVLDAWLALNAKHGGDLPDLVLMGSLRGHETSAILRRIRTNPVLSRKVRFAEEVGSEARSPLYSGATMVLCPSLYEGSDAILVDALAHGAPIIASDLPVLRARGSEALYVPPGDAQALAAAVEQVLVNRGHDRSRVAAADIATLSTGSFEDMVTVLDRRGGTPAVSVFQATQGRWHPLTLLSNGEIRPGVGTGANFRSDAGWFPPTSTGCWTRPTGGEITIGLPGEGPWRLSLQLMGLPARGTRWTLDIEGRETVVGSIDASARRWVVIDDLLAPGGVVRLFLKGLTSDALDLTDRHGEHRSLVGSLGVAGFHVCRQDDWKARETFLETVALGNPSQLGAYA